MSTRSEMLDRHQRAEAARSRLKSGQYIQPQQQAAPEPYKSTRQKMLENYMETIPDTMPSGASMLQSYRNDAIAKTKEQDQQKQQTLIQSGSGSSVLKDNKPIAAPKQGLKGRNLPVIGPILRGLDKVQKFTEPAAKIAEEFYTPGAGLSAMNAFRGAGEALLGKVAPKIAQASSISAKAAKEAILEGAAGIPLGGGQSLARHPENLKGAGIGAVSGALTGSGLGMMSPVVGPAVGKALAPLGKKVQSIMQKWRPAPVEPAAPQPNTLGLPLGREDAARSARAPQPGGSPIAPEYTFKLNQGQDKSPNIESARKDLSDIDNEINQLDGHYEKAIVDEYHYLKNSMGQGKENGGIIKDSLGNVTDRYGFVSKNPKWFQDFTKSTGKKSPSNKDLYELAKQRIDNGFVDEMGEVPSWKIQNGYDEAMGALTGVREQINNSLREMDPAINITDSPLVSQELNFPAKRAETPPNAAAVQEQPVIAPEAQTAPQAQPAPMNSRQAMLARSQTAAGAQTGERGLFRNMRDNGQYSDEFNQSRAAQDNTYEVATDKAALAAANINIQDPQAAMKYLADDKPSKEATTTAIRLMQKLDQAGEHDTALAVYNKLKTDLTNLGQATQAASLIGKLTPEGQLMQLIGTAKQAGKEITVQQKVEFQGLAKEVQENAGAGARNVEFNGILDKIQKGESVNPEELKTLNDFMARAKKVLPDKQKTPKVKDELPEEFKDVKKRQKIVDFLDGAEKAALARIAARKNNLNSLPVNEWADHAIVVASQIGKGSIKAATYAEDLVRLFGEDIRNDAAAVFKQAQSIVRGITRTAGAGRVKEAEQIIRKLSGAEEAEKALVEEAGLHVRKMIEDAKAGKIDQEDIAQLQSYADEVSSFPEPTKKDLTPEQKYNRTVKSLLKKINKVETEKITADQENREVMSLLRQVSNLKEQGLIPALPEKIETDSLRRLSEAALNTKKLTPQQKVVKKFIQTTPELSEQDIDMLRKLSQDVTEMSGNDRFNADLKMQDMMNSFEKSSLYDKALTLRYIGMLWNTTTQLVNVASGVTRAVSGVVEDLPAVFIDKAIVQHFKGKQSVTIHNNNPFTLVSDIFKNVGKGMRAGWHGTNPGGITNIDEVRGLVFKYFDDDNIATKSLKAIPQLLERSLGAVAKGADYAVYKAVVDRELVQQGYLSAKKAGITGKLDIEAHIRKFVEDPPEEALLQADQMGKNTTFQRSDSAGGVVARTVNNLPMVARVPANIVAPFIKTPINILSAAANYSPFGIIKGLVQLSAKNLKASDREALRNIGSGIIGTGVMTPTGYYLNKIGVITGANDTGDKEVNAVRAQMGQDKYKLNTSALGRYLTSFLQDYDVNKAEKAAAFQKGDKQMDYNKLQPFALLPSVGASINENKDKPLGAALGKVGTDALGSFTSMSMLKGIQTLAAPDYNAPVGEGNAKLGSRLAEQALTGFSPSVLAQVARTTDPVQRKTAYNQGIWKDVSEYYKSRLPGLSKTLPAQVTTLGDTKVYAKGVIAQFLNPYKVENVPYNDAAKIITDLIDKTGDTTLAPSAAFKQVTGTMRNGDKGKIAITGKDYEDLQSRMGKEITEKIVAIPKLWPEARKAERIKKIYDDTDVKFKREIKRKNGMRL